MRSIQSALVGGSLLLVALGTGWAQSSDPATAGSAGAGAGVTSTGAVSTPATPVNAQGQTEAEMKAAARELLADCAGLQRSVGFRIPDEWVVERLGPAAVVADVMPAPADPELVASGGQLTDQRDEGLVLRVAGLGQVIIAHTLMANSTATVTMDQLFAMRNDGMGWGQIAQGLNLRLGEVVSAVMSEGSVAQGAAKADGKTAMIHSGASTHAGMHAGAGTAAGAHVGHTNAGVSGSVGVGAGTKVGK